MAPDWPASPWRDGDSGCLCPPWSWGPLLLRVTRRCGLHSKAANEVCIGLTGSLLLPWWLLSPSDDPYDSQSDMSPREPEREHSLTTVIHYICRKKNRDISPLIYPLSCWLQLSRAFLFHLIVVSGLWGQIAVQLTCFLPTGVKVLCIDCIHPFTLTLTYCWHTGCGFYASCQAANTFTHIYMLMTQYQEQSGVWTSNILIAMPPFNHFFSHNKCFYFSLKNLTLQNAAVNWTHLYL